MSSRESTVAPEGVGTAAASCSASSCESGSSVRRLARPRSYWSVSVVEGQVGVQHRVRGHERHRVVGRRALLVRRDLAGRKRDRRELEQRVEQRGPPPPRADLASRARSERRCQKSPKPLGGRAERSRVRDLRLLAHPVADRPEPGGDAEPEPGSCPCPPWPSLRPGASSASPSDRASAACAAAASGVRTGGVLYAGGPLRCVPVGAPAALARDVVDHQRHALEPVLLAQPVLEVRGPVARDQARGR